MKKVKVRVHLLVADGIVEVRVIEVAVPSGMAWTGARQAVDMLRDAGHTCTYAEVVA